MQFSQAFIFFATLLTRAEASPVTITPIRSIRCHSFESAPPPPSMDKKSSPTSLSPPPATSADPTDNISRKLLGTGGHVLHYQETNTAAKIGTAPRDEVVTAVQGAMSGDNNFVEEILNGTVTFFQDLTRDKMELSMEVEDDFSAAFSASGPFVKDDPQTIYHVECPSQADGAVCTVTEMIPEGKDDLVDCRSQEQGIFRDDIPSECEDEDYAISLRAVPNPHFFLVAEKQRVTHGESCPQSIAFQSIGGKKAKHAMYNEDIKGFPSHYLGSATLRSILQAEEGTTALDDSTYDVDTKNCVHYAQSIWRALGFQETEGLATFLIDNVLADDGYAKLVLASKKKPAGVRALVAATIGKGALENHAKDVVYSQLDIF